jgi:serine/threonine-protein kinase
MTQPLIPPYEPPPAYPLAGEVLDGKYQIERMLGEGGMGAVAKATHMLRRAPVALKFMSPAVMSLGGAVERFINEGVAASQIDSDHVVKVFDVGQLKSGAPYLVMEYLEGIDLSDLLAREGTPGLTIARAVHFILQALRGLQVAHAAGIVHRDMKPSNIFVITKDGEPDFVKLVDFGISKVQQPGGGNITRTNSALGTPLYMSPEQARSPRDVDLRSDLYSVGVILYELLTGRTPFHSDTGEFTEILFKIFTQDPPPIKSLRADLPDPLADVIHRALARDPKDRFSTTTEMGDALGPWADHRSQHVLTRLRLAGGRAAASIAPLGPATTPMAAPIGHSVIPPAMGHMTGAEALAKTQGSQPGVAPPMAMPVSIPQAASVPRPAASPVAPGAPRTDVGVSREVVSIATPTRAKRSPLVFIVPIVGVAALVGAGAFFLRNGGGPATSGSVSRDPAAVTPPVPPPPESSLPLTPSASASATVPAPSASHAPSATAPTSSGQRIGPPLPPPSVKTGVARPPGDLGDLTGKQ